MLAVLGTACIRWCWSSPTASETTPRRDRSRIGASEDNSAAAARAAGWHAGIDRPKVVGHARPLPQLNDSGSAECDLTERAEVRSEEDSVSASGCRLGARWREPVPEAVELLRIDGIDLEPRSSSVSTGRGNLYGNMDVFRLAPLVAMSNRTLCSPAAMFEGLFASRLPLASASRHRASETPIDAANSLCLMHLIFRGYFELRDISGRTGAQGRVLHWASYRGPRGTCKQALSEKGAGSRRLLAGSSVLEGADLLAGWFVRYASLQRRGGPKRVIPNVRIRGAPPGTTSASHFGG